MLYKKKFTAYFFFLCIFLIVLNQKSVYAENTLIIEFCDVEWPPTCYFGDGNTFFSMIVTFNVTNSGDLKYITTPNSNLLYPYMIVDVGGFYAEYEGTGGFCMVTDHTIISGIISISVGMGFEIPDYNNSKVPQGRIIFWSDFASHTHPYTVEIYNTTMYINSDGEITNEQTTKLNIDKYIILSCMTIVVFVLFRKRYKL